MYYANDLDIYNIFSEHHEFSGLRLLNANRHNEDLILKSGRFAGVPKEDLVCVIKCWLRSQGILADDKRIWKAMKIAGAEKERVFGALDRRGL